MLIIIKSIEENKHKSPLAAIKPMQVFFFFYSKWFKRFQEQLRTSAGHMSVCLDR